ncbi:MAG: hypothetical protein SGPRY_010489 [Prymnesium sp.]
MSAPPPPLPSCYGVDVGATTSSCCDAGGELYRNELGGHATATLLSISGSERKLGEAAVGCLSSNPKGTVPMVGLVALTPHNSLLTSPLAPHLPFSHHAGDDGFATLSLPYAGSPRAFSSLGALGALLGKMRSTTGAPPGSPLAIPLLPSLPASDIIPRLSDAAAIGGWALVAAPSPGEAMGAALARKFPFKSEDAGGAPRILLLADVGHSSTSATVLSLLPPPLLAKGEEAKTGASEQRWSVLAEASEDVGCAHFDALLFEHFSSQIESKHGEKVERGSRRGHRLMGAVERVRKLLSTMGEASATAENLTEGVDVNIKLSREELAELIAPLIARLKGCFVSVLEAEAVATISLDGVEAVGGGMRMPVVQAAVSEALSSSKAGCAIATDKFGAKLDDASLAVGAALIGRARQEEAAAAKEGEGALVPGGLETEELARLIAEEAELGEADAAAAALAARRNEFEGFVLESRGLSGRKHSELVRSSELTPILDAAEDWLYSEEGEGADLSALGAKLDEVKAGVAAATEEYQAKLAEVKAADEAALEAASAAAAAEKAANGEEEDHDTRRLKFPERLRLVSKNKEEGTELFQGQNWRPAAARYNKALTHAAKFIDLSPEQAEEVKALKLSLHLNIAQCWLKITDAENHLTQAGCSQPAIRSCDEALELDPDSVKAMYRRAFAKEAKGDYDASKQDLKRAAELAPEDAAVSKLMARVDAQLARQKAKEKKMYGSEHYAHIESVL